MSLTSPAQGVALLGATGSIGVNALDVIARHPDRYRVVALAADCRDEALFEQCLRFRPAQVAMRNEAAAERLRARLRSAGVDLAVGGGADAVAAIGSAEGASIVVSAIVGAAGLFPTLAAVRAGKRVLLANKEPLVMCGPVFMQEARRSGALLLPLDSEHNAIFQCMPAGYRTGSATPGVRRVFLTASGGPFRLRDADTLSAVTPEEAVAHPNWKMGPKISVDSATLMNKGLELIEACHLFALAPEQVEVVIHPQSTIHSLVEYEDGSLLAQLGQPDMRIPIAHALAWPERMASGASMLDLAALRRLDFEAPDEKRFPCLALGRAAARTGGTAPAILNAANEIAVAAFLEGNLRFTDIPRVIEATLSEVPCDAVMSLESVLDADRRARVTASRLVGGDGCPGSLGHRGAVA